MGLLSFVSRPRAPAVLCGHRGGAAQRIAAEEDRTVHPRKGKAPDLDVWVFFIQLNKMMSAETANKCYDFYVVQLLAFSLKG